MKLLDKLTYKIKLLIIFAEAPPRVEYRLTEKSKELLRIFRSLSEWGMYLINEHFETNTYFVNSNLTISLPISARNRFDRYQV